MNLLSILDPEEKAQPDRIEAILKVTANSTSTSHVIRDSWGLERILGTAPTKPPPDIAAIEPDIRGGTTIREQLAKHGQVESCVSCHEEIDPPGFALESCRVETKTGSAESRDRWSLRRESEITMIRLPRQIGDVNAVSANLIFDSAKAKSASAPHRAESWSFRRFV